MRCTAILALAFAACSAPHTAEPAPAGSVRVVVDGSAAGRAPHGRDVRVLAGDTALDATRAAFEVEQGWVCCSDDDVWAVDGIASDAARDGYWSWWLDGELGPGFAHQVDVHDGAIVEWRFGLADPEGRGAEPVARIAALGAEACAAIEAFGGGRNLVAHGEACGLPRHAALPRLSPSALHERWRALELDACVDAAGAPDGLRALAFAPGARRADWEALGQLCGRLGAARAAWTARTLAP